MCGRVGLGRVGREGNRRWAILRTVLSDFEQEKLILGF